MLRRVMGTFVALVLVATLLLPLASVGAQEEVLPLAPPRTVHAVAEVVYVLEPPGSQAFYRTGFRFLHIDERDRDQIFGYISQLQLIRLREMSENRPFPQKVEKNDKPALSLEQLLLRVLYWLVFLAIGLFIGKGLMDYRERGDQNEIKIMYEKSIKKYRKESPY